MSSLENFLALPDFTEEIHEIKVNERIGIIKIKPLNMDEYAHFQRKARTNVVDGKHRNLELNFNKFYALITASQMIEPDISNAEFLKEVKCITALDFVTKKLKPGEIIDIGTKIAKISGFVDDINEDIEEAKK